MAVTGDDDQGVRVARRRRVRRYVLFSVGITALAVVPIILSARTVHLAWWVALPIALPLGAVGVWRDMRNYRVDEVRSEALEGDETALSEYGVRLDGVRSPSADLGASPIRLRLTTRRLQLWDRDAQLWSHPWQSVRLTADGELILVHQEGELIARLVLTTPAGSVDELLLAGERLRVRAQRRS